MIRAVAMRGTVPTLLVGLTADAMERLLSGSPVTVAGRDLGLPTDLVLIAGTTDEAIMDTFREAGLLPPTEEGEGS